MTRAAIEAVMEMVPELNDSGIGVCDKSIKSEEERQATMARWKEELLDSVVEFQATCVWLGRLEKSKKINEDGTSYGLKHIAAHQIGYITNGVFIAAAIHCGFDYETYPGHPSVCFNMSKKSVRKAWDEAQELSQSGYVPLLDR